VTVSFYMGSPGCLPHLVIRKTLQLSLVEAPPCASVGELVVSCLCLFFLVISVQSCLTLTLKDGMILFIFIIVAMVRL
jgi:hypothetical protein